MSFNPLEVCQPLYRLIQLSFFPVLFIGDVQCRHNELYFVFQAV